MSTPLLLLFLLCFPFSLAAVAGERSDSFLFELHRRPALPRLDQSCAAALRQAPAAHDPRAARAFPPPAGSFAAPAPAPTSFEMPLNSGAYAGTDQYFVRFQLGTPAQRFELVADTGSDLTWDMCRNSSDGSAGHSIVANESATVISSDGRRTKLWGLVVGCTSSAVGSNFHASDGVLGLGYSDNSFAVRAGPRLRDRHGGVGALPGNRGSAAP
ncbi:hypothetical protein ZIOFF_012953 [Zingiber officinale]|uniref:Peptidase A1 domain-containing protein n=1 Tax=Zingiber officinale TaxID=94328 RepID=A0A8J5HB21_ZINOF|nr:hypothetical protein ZIOFF_012953 [Zingiber officinale]